MFSLILVGVSLGTLESRPTRSKSTGPGSEQTTQTAHTNANTYRGEERRAPGGGGFTSTTIGRVSGTPRGRIESGSVGGTNLIVHASLLEQILQNSCTTTDKQEHLKHVRGGGGSEELSVIL